MLNGMARTLEELRKLIPSPPNGTGYEVLTADLTSEESFLLAVDDFEQMAKDHSVPPRL